MYFTQPIRRAARAGDFARRILRDERGFLGFLSKIPSVLGSVAKSVLGIPQSAQQQPSTVIYQIPQGTPPAASAPAGDAGGTLASLLHNPLAWVVVVAVGLVLVLLMRRRR